MKLQLRQIEPETDTKFAVARTASQVHIRIIQVSSLVVESGHTRKLPVSMRASASFQLILRIIMYLTALTTHSPIVCHAHTPLPIIPFPVLPSSLPVFLYVNIAKVILCNTKGNCAQDTKM